METARPHFKHLERVGPRAEAKILERTFRALGSGEMGIVLADKAERTQAELRDWLAAGPLPTPADDERAINDLIGEGAKEK